MHVFLAVHTGMVPVIKFFGTGAPAPTELIQLVMPRISACEYYDWIIKLPCYFNGFNDDLFKSFKYVCCVLLDHGWCLSYDVKYAKYIETLYDLSEPPQIINTY